MTVTKRRVKAGGDESGSGGLATEPGIKYTCDFCADDITATVRIKCAAKECEEVDLCPNCFMEGREIQQHKAWHDYKVVEKHSKPIFHEDWGADEELLLITGLQTYGLGNWQEVAQQVGTRTKEDCEKHYLDTYLKEKPGKKEFLPKMNMKFKITQDEFSSRKRRRLEKLREPQPLSAAAMKTNGSQPSNHEVAGYMPGRLEFDIEHENEAEVVIKDMEFGLVMGYGGDEQPEAPEKLPGPVPGETEEGADPPEDEVMEVVKLDEGAAVDETGRVAAKPSAGVKGKQPQKSSKTVKAVPVKTSEMDVDGEVKEKKPKPKDPDSESEDEAPPQKIVLEVEEEEDVELKLAVLEIYYQKLQARTAVKDIIFERGLLNHKANMAADKKRTKEERDVVNRYKVFAKMQTAEDFELLIDGLIYEQTLRKRINDLQEYRKQGITTLDDAERFDVAKVQRTTGYRTTPIPRVPMSNIDRLQHRVISGRLGPPIPDPVTRGGANPDPEPPRAGSSRPPNAPISLTSASDIDLLTPEEKAFIAKEKILPKPYLMIKDMMIREAARRGGSFRRLEAKKMVKFDVQKAARIYDLLKANGMMYIIVEPKKDTSSTAPLAVPGHISSGVDASPSKGQPSSQQHQHQENGVSHAMDVDPPFASAPVVINGHA